MSDDADLDSINNSSSFLNIPISRRHEFYISGNVMSPESYTSTFHTIRNAGESDEIIIHINSVGGDLFTAIQFMRVLTESRATITTSVEGACMSAATMIFLAGHQYAISDHSIFMFHNYSSGAWGKGGELFDQITHERAWSSGLLESTYKHFLTKEEINAILDNKDIYMNSDEVVDRLNKRYELTEKDAKKQMKTEAKRKKEKSNDE